MVKLLDHYSEFRRAMHTCMKCDWRGTGAMMKNGNCSGLRIDKHCPECGELYGFAKFSVIAENDDLNDWPPVS